MDLGAVYHRVLVTFQYDVLVSGRTLARAEPSQSSYVLTSGGYVVHLWLVKVVRVG